MDEINGKLGQKIRELRESQNLTQEKLGDRIGVSQDYLSRIEQGKKNPTVNLLYKIAGGLGVQVCDLIEF